MGARSKAAMLSVVATWALVLSPAAWQLARAQAGGEQLQRGLELYNELDYEEAIEVLEAALGEPGLSAEERVEGFGYLALSYLALGRDDDVRRTYRRLLEVDPTYRPPLTISDKARDLLEEVRRTMPVAVTLSQAVAPASPARGAAITVSIAVADPAQQYRTVVVYHRPQGQASYSSVTALLTAAGRYTATIPGAFVTPPALEYYVAALAADGAPVATEGTADDPLLILVGAAQETAAPIYARWWFWTTLGVVLAGGLAGYGLTRGGSSDDATVTVVVDLP